MRLLSVLSVAFVLSVGACKKTPPASADAGAAVAVSADRSAVVDAGSAPPPAPRPEPEGIAAGSKKPAAAPSGSGTATLDPTATSVSFTIVSNSAGPITGTFPGGASGAIDTNTRKGVFTIDLAKLSSVNKDGAKNPVRDTNVLESFFAARPMTNAALQPAVDAVWQRLAGKIAAGVGTATLVVTNVEGIAQLREEAPSTGVVDGKLVLWDSVEVPVSFPVSITRKGDVLEVTGTAPSTFDIEKATGTTLRTALFDAMIAAGCAHQPGIQNAVSVNLDKVTLKLTK